MAENNRRKIETIFVVLAVLVVSGFIVWATRGYFLRQQTAAERAKTLTISEFSLNGEVINVIENGFEIRTGWVEETKAGKKFITYDKKIEINNNTKFYFNQNFSLTELSEGRNNISVGDRITVYGSEYPYNLNIFKALRVDILK